MKAILSVSLICGLALVLGRPIFAQTTSNPPENSCRAFVRGFYDWYITVVLRFDKEAPWHIALQRRPRDFSPALAAALKRSDAEAKAEGDPVLDFEPLLNSQDPSNRYEVEAVTIKNEGCLATVSAKGKPRGEVPNVIAELVQKGGQWIFVNFRYPSAGGHAGTDLMSILHAHYKQ